MNIHNNEAGRRVSQTKLLLYCSIPIERTIVILLIPIERTIVILLYPYWTHFQFIFQILFVSIKQTKYREQIYIYSKSVYHD